MEITIKLTNINTIKQLQRHGDEESLIIDLLNEHFENNKICSCGRELDTDNEKHFDTCIFCIEEEREEQRDIFETQKSLRS